MVLGLLWIRSEFEAWRSKKDLQSVWYGATTFVVKDANTRNELAATLHQGPYTAGQVFPKVTSIALPGKRLRLEYVAIEPMTVGVHVDGYKDKRVTLTSGTPETLEVLLRRLASTSSESQPSTQPTTKASAVKNGYKSLAEMWMEAYPDDAPGKMPLWP